MEYTRRPCVYAQTVQCSLKELPLQWSHLERSAARRLFPSFGRGEAESREEGTGLVLSIAKSIAKSHGWTLSVTESKENGVRSEIVEA